jgi:hypothetical protein
MDRRAAPEDERAVVGHRAGDVTADGHEPGVSDGELPGEAVDQVQRDRQQAVDADVHHQLLVERPQDGHDHELQDERNDDAGHDRPHGTREHPTEARPQRVRARAQHQTFSTVALPSNPAGRTSRTMINSEKT